MNSLKIRSFFNAIVLAMVAATFSISVFGQQVAAPIFPHDFSDAFYEANGVKPAFISGRLTGSDFLSVKENTDHPHYADVRALITLPAYTAKGEHRFWTPLGVINMQYVTEEALNIATRHPMYVFQFPTLQPGVRPFSNLRQAPIFDDQSAGFEGEPNPLGLRYIITVDFVPPTTGKGKIVLEEMRNRNGEAADGNPLVKTIADLNTLIAYGLVVLSKGNGDIAIAPLIPENRQIAKDAFLVQAMKDGKPLPSEEIFVKKFQCLQQTDASDGPCFF